MPQHLLAYFSLVRYVGGKRYHVKNVLLQYWCVDALREIRAHITSDNNRPAHMRRFGR